MAHALAYDGSNNPDVLAMIAAFAAVRDQRHTLRGDAWARCASGTSTESSSAWPIDSRRRDESRLDLVVAGHRDGIAMVEASARELSEEEMIDALELAQNHIQEIVELIDELQAQRRQAASRNSCRL